MPAGRTKNQNSNLVKSRFDYYQSDPGRKTIPNVDQKPLQAARNPSEVNKMAARRGSQAVSSAPRTSKSMISGESSRCSVESFQE